MAYEVTATKKRPRGFEEVAGQEFVVSTLKNSLKSGRIAHAYLFSGPRGVGKTSAARILARCLNCVEGPTETPCGVCSSCIEITKGNALDVIEIDGASNTSVNDVREIKDEVLFAPNSSRYKVYIIDEVHMLSNSAFNALLKTIEEPPPYIVFVFATTEIHKVPATIRSRCQQFSFRLIGLEAIKGLLSAAAAEMDVTAEDEALFWIAKEAGGSLRDAYTLFDQIVSFSENSITMDLIREKLGLVGLDAVNGIAGEMAEGNTMRVIELSNEVLMRGVSVEQFVIDLAEYFRNILFLKNSVTKESLLGYSPERFSKTVVTSFSVSQLELAIESLLQLYRNIRYSLNQRFELELVLSRLSALNEYITPGEILCRINTLRDDLFQKSISLSDTGSAVTEVPASEGVPDQAAASPLPEGNTTEDDINIFEDDEDDSAYATTTDVSANSPEPEYISRNEGIAKADIEKIVAVLKKKKLALASSLEKAYSWTLDKDVINIHFEAGYPANVIKSELQMIKEKTAEVLGKRYEIAVLVEKQHNSSTGQCVDPEAELIKKVFRGQIIQGA